MLPAPPLSYDLDTLVAGYFVALLASVSLFFVYRISKTVVVSAVVLALGLALPHAVLLATTGSSNVPPQVLRLAHKGLGIVHGFLSQAVGAASFRDAAVAALRDALFPP